MVETITDAELSSGFDALTQLATVVLNEHGTRRQNMKPLIYGYMRFASDAPDDELDGIEQQMRRFAEVKGFCYAATFFEHQSGSHAAFDELIQELKRAEARHVVVPSFAHLSSHRILCNSMVERLELGANALVLTPDGS